MFSCEYCEIFKIIFLYRVPPVAASENLWAMSKEKSWIFFPKTSNQKRLQKLLLTIVLNTKVKAMNNYQSRNTLKTMDRICLICKMILKTLTKKINFMSSKNNDDKLLMHSKSDNKEIMTGFYTCEIIEKLFN